MKGAVPKAKCEAPAGVVLMRTMSTWVTCETTTGGASHSPLWRSEQPRAQRARPRRLGLWLSKATFDTLVDGVE